MSRAVVRVRSAIAIASFMLAVPAMAHELSPSLRTTTPAASAEIYGHGVLRQADRVLEAVVEVGADLLSNIQAGQQVWMDVRQGHIHGVVKCVHSPVEVTISLDGVRSNVKLSHLQAGQAVIATFQLDPDCDQIPLEM
ncbi:MAG TPA: hypothetical protein VGL53_26455 [Bryobacteraceae bacterium]